MLAQDRVSKSPPATWTYTDTTVIMVSTHKKMREQDRELQGAWAVPRLEVWIPTYGSFTHAA